MMTFISNVPEQEHNPTNDVQSARDTDPLHEALQDHIAGCDHCRKAIDTDRPHGFGERATYCGEYFRIVRAWATGEFTRDS